MIIYSAGEINYNPKRIVSVVPSQTELLYDLGLGESVIGITKFCIHPTGWTSEKVIVGGTKNLRMDVIHRLNPDLIIANKEENVKEQIEELAKHFTVLVTNISNFTDALQMMEQLGIVTGKKQQALKLVEQIQTKFNRLKPDTTANGKLPIVSYLIWKDPYMTIGGDTFIHDMMKRIGLQNLFGNQKRYPAITVEELEKADLIFLSSEPYPFKQADIIELQTVYPDKKIMLVNGEMFSWYGSRMLPAADYFEELLKE